MKKLNENASFPLFFQKWPIPLLGMNNIGDTQILASLCHLKEVMESHTGSFSLYDVCLKPSAFSLTASL